MDPKWLKTKSIQIGACVVSDKPGFEGRCDAFHVALGLCTGLVLPKAGGPAAQRRMVGCLKGHF